MLWNLLLACTPTADPTDSDVPTLEPSYRVVTFNTGTTEGLPHDPAFDGYGEHQAAISDEHYGDGLAWLPALEAVAAFIEAEQPDLIAFQEIFDPADCDTIPTELHAGFVCETWTPDQGHVAELVTGPAYTVSCHPGKTDKCVAVHERLGTVEGPMEGREIDGCGSGSRIARLQVPVLGNVVSVHGSSGLGVEDQECRRQQVEAIFSGSEPLVGDGPNLVLGDLNTDPGRWGTIDTSAAAWNDHVGQGAALDWVTDASDSSEPSYQGLVAIDHVASDHWSGSCFTQGVGDTAPIYAGVYFDHHPVVCSLTEAR